jgi:hypothetical protein
LSDGASVDNLKRIVPASVQLATRSSPEDPTFRLRATRARCKLLHSFDGGHVTARTTERAHYADPERGRFKRFSLVHHHTKSPSLSRWPLGRTDSEGLGDSGCDEFDVMLASSGGSRLDYNRCDNIIVRVSSTVLRLLVWQADPLRKTVYESGEVLSREAFG